MLMEKVTFNVNGKLGWKYMNEKSKPLIYQKFTVSIFVQMESYNKETQSRKINRQYF